MLQLLHLQHHLLEAVNSVSLLIYISCRQRVYHS
jgi:hypothetical protein